LGEDGVEALYGSEGYDVGVGEAGAGGEDFGSVGDYIDVGQCKCAGHFAEEGGLLVIRFDQRQVDVRGPDLQRKGGESGAGADVEDARSAVVSGQWLAISTQYRVPSRTRNTSRSFATLRMTGFGECREEVAGEEEGLAEVAGYDFFGMADGGQVDAGIPAE
jgi:hypothetical protein